MGRALNQEGRQVWQTRLERQSASGLSIGAFCRRERVSEGSFYSWKRELGSKRVSRSAAKTPSARSRSSAPMRRAVATVGTPGAARPHQRVPAVSGQDPSASSAAFVQVPLPAQRGAAWIELLLADGTIVRLPQHNLAAFEVALASLMHPRAS